MKIGKAGLAILFLVTLAMMVLPGCNQQNPQSSPPAAPTAAATETPGPAASATPGAATPATAPGTAAPAPKAKVRVIWDYKKELGLTDDQINKMKAAVGDLQNQLIILRLKNSANELELRQLNLKNAPSDQLKKKIKEVADIQGEMRFIDLETAKKINGILSKEQLDKWHDIQKAEAAKEAAKQAGTK